MRTELRSKSEAHMVSHKKILVAMSGGVDSSVAAWLLRKSGWEVVGATLLLHPGVAEPDPALSRLCADLAIKCWRSIR